MKNIYIIKRGDSILSFYYGENKSIYMQKLYNNNIEKVKVIENVLDYFSVSLNKNDEIYIFCQSQQGNIMILKSKKNDFEALSLFDQDFKISNRTICVPLFFENNISVIFNSLTENNRENYISIKTLIQQNNWTKTENIDIFSISNNNIFEAQKINEQDAIIVYEKRDKDIQLGFKEIINGKISPFNIIHRTGYQVVDFSFLSLDNKIHFIYIVKNLFSSQVIYRRKDENGISAPIILYEGQKVKNCNIAFIENKLYCMYVINNSLFYCISNDLGKTFLGVSKYKKNFNQDIIKCNFITSVNTKGIYLNEVYVDYKNPLNIQFIPEIYPNYISKVNYTQQYKTQVETFNLNNNFISDLTNQNININNNINNIEKDNNKNNIIITPTINRSYKTVKTESDFMAHFDPTIFENILKNKQLNSYKEQNFNKQNNISLDTESNDFIKNKLKIANEEIEEKNNQLIKLNNIIQEKNKERLDIELDLRRKLKFLEEENKKLKEQSLANIITSERENEINVEKNVPQNNESRKE